MRIKITKKSPRKSSRSDRNSSYESKSLRKNLSQSEKVWLFIGYLKNHLLATHHDQEYKVTHPKKTKHFMPLRQKKIVLVNNPILQSKLVTRGKWSSTIMKHIAGIS